MLVCILALGGCAAAPTQSMPEDDTFTIMTSFYPMYVFTLNVADGAQGVSISNMAAPDTGCLHDYQLLPADIRALEDAGVLVINGAGMESFMDKVLSQYPNLPVVTASDGVDMISESHGDHTHANAHVWLNPALAAKQVENIAASLALLDANNAQIYLDNGAAYAQKLRALGVSMKQTLSNVKSRQMITFHEAFPYFAQAFDLEIAGVIEHEPGEEPGTQEVAQICDLVKELGIHALFAEPQYPDRVAQTIASETGAKVYTLDPIVTGELGDKNAYEDKMNQNLSTLLEALSQ